MSEQTLSDVMDFEHVIKVLPDGTVTEPTTEERNKFRLWAPVMCEGELESPESFWSLMTGYTGQHGYNGPSMHSSEFIGGRMERDILANPGYYVAILDKYIGCYNDENLDESEVKCSEDEGCDCEDNGWAVAYHHLDTEAI